MEQEVNFQENLLSKKKLLEMYSISYGALYRWKRKGLIPDEWFIKKSTVTGQETFFPKKLICERVELILSMKDDILLDDLAKQFSGQEETSDAIVFNTDYGEKKIYINDIKSVNLVLKNGSVQEITQTILNLFGKDE